MKTIQTVKGMTSMKIYISDIYRNYAIKNCIKDLISNYDYKSFSQLNYYDKCEIAALCVSACESLDYIHQAHDSEKTIRKMNDCLVSGTEKSKDDLFYIMQEAACDYYHDIIKVLFCEVYDELPEGEEYDSFNQETGRHTTSTRIY